MWFLDCQLHTSIHSPILLPVSSRAFPIHRSTKHQFPNMPQFYSYSFPSSVNNANLLLLIQEQNTTSPIECWFDTSFSAAIKDACALHLRSNSINHSLDAGARNEMCSSSLGYATGDGTCAEQPAGSTAAMIEEKRPTGPRSSPGLRRGQCSAR